MIFTSDFASARVRPSPNINERKDGISPDAIILHYTGMKTAKGAEDWLCDTRSQVSSHYLVYEDGSVVQMVPEKRSEERRVGKECGGRRSAGLRKQLSMEKKYC